jgi:hypothetical protein
MEGQKTLRKYHLEMVPFEITIVCSDFKALLEILLSYLTKTKTRITEILFN